MNSWLNISLRWIPYIIASISWCKVVKCRQFDLTDTYYTVPIALYQKFLKYKVGSLIYQFTCLPNGLSYWPRVFTKLMKSVLSKLRQRGFLSSTTLNYKAKWLGLVKVTWMPLLSFSKIRGVVINVGVSSDTTAWTFGFFILNSVSMT